MSGSRDLRQRGPGGKQQPDGQQQPPHEHHQRPPKRPSRPGRPSTSPRLAWLLVGAATALAAFFLQPRMLLDLLSSLRAPPPPPELSPLPGAPRLTTSLAELADPAHRGGLMWGSYRSGLYFGMSIRSPTPLVTGLMWFDPDLPTPVRHAAEQGDRAPEKHGWQRHDGRGYGRQRIVDGAYDLTVHMVKRATNATLRSGGDWAVRLSVGPERPPPDEAAARRRAEERAEFEHLLPPDPNLRPPKRRVALLWYIGDARWEASPGAGITVGVPPLPAGARGAAGRRRRLGEKGLLLAQGVAHPDVGGGGWSVRAVPGDGGGSTGLAAPTRHAAAASVRVLAMRPRAETFGGGGGGGIGGKRPEPGEGPGAEALVRAAEIVRQDLLQGVRERGLSRGFNMELSDAREARPTLLFVQITVELPATVDIVFTPHSVDRGKAGGSGGDKDEDGEDDGEETLEQRAARLSGAALTSLIAEREAEFDARFDRTFRVPDEDVPPVVRAVEEEGEEEEGGKNAAAAAGRHNKTRARTVVVSAGVSAAEVKEAAKAALSNLLGTMGYFHGRSRVLVRGLPLPGAPPYAPSGPLPGAAPGTVVGEAFPASLFTAVPSRSTFPRGFLWDEGFHQLLVRRWDAALCRDALAHWLDLLTATGWVPREQILGAEARSRVPAEFVVQRPGHGNPPSLLLPLMEMAEDVQRRAGRRLARRAAAAAAGAAGRGEAEAGKEDEDAADLLELRRGAEFLARAWPRLEAWYGWFNRTQAGSAPGTYRWHGRAPVPAPLTAATTASPSSSSSASAQAAQWRAAASAAPDEAAKEEAEAAALALSPPPLPPRLGAARAELNPKTLTSGLDDYPRASHPSPDERHLDLRCWVALASRGMASIARAARDGQEAAAAAAAAAAFSPSAKAPPPPPEGAAERYDAAFRALADLGALRRLHLDEASGEFRDFGLHTEDVRLGRARVAVATAAEGDGGGGGGGGKTEPPLPAVREEIREVREEHGSPPRPGLVPAYGYVSLFPLLTGLLPPGSPELARQLALLKGEGRRRGSGGGDGDDDADAALWTPHGLRSLAPSSPLYRARNTADDPPYWRGQVWININYLALRALRRYAVAEAEAATGAGGASGAGGTGGAADEAARSLRHALLRTVAGGYSRTGFFWEQYDDRTGEGMGSRPFTGWTALVTLIAADEEV